MTLQVPKHELDAILTRVYACPFNYIKKQEEREKNNPKLKLIETDIFEKINDHYFGKSTMRLIRLTCTTFKCPSILRSNYV